MMKCKYIPNKREFSKYIRSLADFEGNSPLRFYKAIPEKIWLLGESDLYNGKFVDKRVKVNLSF